MLAFFRWFHHEAGIRFLFRRRAAVVSAVATVALAIAANVNALAVLRAFFTLGLGVPDADRLVSVSPLQSLPGRGEVLFSDAYPNYELIARTAGPLTAVTAMIEVVPSWAEGDETRPVRAARVTASFFATMAVTPRMGRAFDADAEGPEPDRVAVVSHEFWQGSLAGDAAVLNRHLTLDGEPYAIVGVMPPGFSLPVDVHVWLPFDITPRQRTSITGARALTVYGRMAPGTSEQAMQAHGERLTAAALEANPVDNRNYRYALQPVRDILLGDADASVLLVQVGAALLLVLTLFNIASMLLAWALERKTEFAVRQALGASLRDVARGVMLQGMALVGMGAIVGLALSWAMLPWLRQLDVAPGIAFFLAGTRITPALAATSLLVALSGAALAGLLPLVLTSHADLADDLRKGSRSVTLSPATVRWQNAMVVFQTMISVSMLAAAVMLVASFLHLNRVPLGYRADGVLVARASLQGANYATPAARERFGADLLARLEADRRVGAAGFTSTLPVGDIRNGGRFVLELPDGGVTEEPVLLHLRRVSPGYLATMGVSLRDGRGFDNRDGADGAPAAIVSASLAQRFWPGESAVGKRLLRVMPGNPPAPLTVVGVVGSTIDAGNAAPPGETVYVPWAQQSVTRMSIVVRPAPGSVPDAALGALRDAIREVDAGIALQDVTTLERLVERDNVLPRLRGLLLLLFAGTALLIAALGTYGFISQMVTMREREFAMRLVFGASPGRVGRLVLAGVARLTVPGVVLGLTAVAVFSGALRSFVFGIAERPWTLLAAVGVGMAIVALTVAIPSALRAMRVDIGRVGAGA